MAGYLGRATRCWATDSIGRSGAVVARLRPRIASVRPRRRARRTGPSVTGPEPGEADRSFRTHSQRGTDPLLMRVLLIAQWFPPIIGGEEAHVDRLGRALVERG